MRLMHDDAPPPPSAADRCTRPLTGADPAVNALHDALNAALPWLWWPLRVPSDVRRLAVPEHALYAVHAGLGITLACALAPRPARRRVAGAGALLAAASWAVFTGAWDRRADQDARSERRAT